MKCQASDRPSSSERLRAHGRRRDGVAIGALDAVLVPGLSVEDAALAARVVLADRTSAELLRVAAALAVLGARQIPSRVRRGKSVRSILDAYSASASWGE